MQSSKISRGLIAFQFSNYHNIYSRAIHVLRMMMGVLMILITIVIIITIITINIVITIMNKTSL